MIKVKSVAIFYSKNSNLVLAEKIKSTLDMLKIYTNYLREIDDVILKNFSKINYLILDFTENILDDRSLELLKKLEKNGYIKNILIVNKVNVQTTNQFDSIEFNENFCKNLKLYFIRNKSLISLEDFNINWVPNVGEYLVELGIPAKLLGYSLLIDSIIFFARDNFVSRNMVATLYPFLANKYQTTPTNVEMCLRTAITSAYKKTQFKGYFTKCPTIKEFINFSTTQIYDKINNSKITAI